MKKYLSMLVPLGLMIILAQPAFSQCCPVCPQSCCPTGCAVEVQAPVCPPQVVYQPKLTYQNKTICQPQISYQSKTILEPRLSYKAQQICEPKVVYEPKAVCPVGAAAPICCPQCPQPLLMGAAAPICCPQKRGFWTKFKEDFLGFD